MQILPNKVTHFKTLLRDMPTTYRTKDLTDNHLKQHHLVDCVPLHATLKWAQWITVCTTGWLKIKYPTRQYAISSQPVVKF